MLYIWDNGESYEDHDRTIVASDLARDDTLRLMALRDVNGELIGAAQRIDFEPERGPVPVAVYVSPENLLNPLRALVYGGESSPMPSRAALHTMIREWRALGYAALGHPYSVAVPEVERLLARAVGPAAAPQAPTT